MYSPEYSPLPAKEYVAGLIERARAAQKVISEYSPKVPTGDAIGTDPGCYSVSSAQALISIMLIIHSVFGHRQPVVYHSMQINSKVKVILLPMIRKLESL